MTKVNLPKAPTKSSALLRKGVIPVAFMSALTGPVALHHLERWEGNVLRVYADPLARGLPTYCAGRTDWSAPVGARLTSDQCQEVNKTTILEYGYAVLACMEWKYLTENSLIAFTLFAVNVGKEAACNSTAAKTFNSGQVRKGCYLIAYKPSGQPNWSYASGVFVQGLHNRRKAEADLCLKDWT